MVEFYLETNAIRVLSRDLKDLKDLCFTSSLTLMELIGGITEKEFDLRKAVVTNILNSGILVDWRSPLEIIVSAFPSLRIRDDIGDSLKNLAKLLIESQSYDEFKNESNSQKLGLDHFSKIDNDFGTEYRESMMDKFKELKVLKNEGTDKKIFIVTIEKAITSIFKSLTHSTRELPPDVDIMESYNGYINIFINLWVWHSNNKLSEWNQAKKNDWIDLHHALYLCKDPVIKLVTDDKMLIEGFNLLYPDRALQVNELAGRKLK